MTHRTVPIGWPLALFGLFLTVFAALALTGPGRIDIIDGQARYEVARSLVEHGDVVVRDPDLWFPIATGRDGQTYVPYRLPQSLLGVAAILLADAAGPPSEARRHFYFALTSAVAGACLAVGYAVWFRRHGWSARAALGWAAAGILCLPNWYYATSTFDDILGAATVVLALLCAAAGRQSFVAAVTAGLWLGVAFNCKQPLGIFVLPALAAVDDPARPWRARVARWGVVVGGLALGVAAYQAYEWYCFPEGIDKGAVPFSPPFWSAAPLVTLAAQCVSPSCGLLLYAPAVLLGLAGLAPAWRSDRRFTAALAAAAAGYVGFIGLLAFGKGDVGWGPRYLTPVFAALWLLAPAGAARLRPGRAGLLLGLGAGVQLLALTADPHRTYIRSGLQPKYLLFIPTAHFDLRMSHLLLRPAEVWEVLTSDARPERFSPAPYPTYAIPLPDPLVDNPESLRRYHLFNSLRPWLCCQWHLPPDQRPVDLGRTAGLLATLGLAGIALIGVGLRREGTA
jgi:hypothetical protein